MKAGHSAGANVTSGNEREQISSSKGSSGPSETPQGPSEKITSQPTPRRAIRADSPVTNSSGSVSGTSRQSRVAQAVPGTTFSL